VMIWTKELRKTSLAASILVLGVFALVGDAQPATIAGFVTDSHNSPVSAAHISVKDLAGKIVGQGDADSKGHYSIGGISSGEYDVTVTLPGTNYLGNTIRTGIRLEGFCLNWTVSQTENALATGRLGATLYICNPAVAATAAGAVIAGGVLGGLAISGGLSSGSPPSSASPAF